MKKSFLGFLLFFFIALSGLCLAQTKILIVDYLASDPIVFVRFFENFQAPDYRVDYRRFYPQLVETDVDYDVIVLASSRHPFPSAAKMTLAEARFLKDYILNGGILVALYSSEENDRVVLNELLRDLSLSVRIEGKAIADPVNGYRSFLVPSAFYLNYPLLRVSANFPLGKGVSKIYGGKCFSLLAEPSPNLAIPLYSFETALRMEGFQSAERSGQKGREGLYLAGSYEVAVMAVGKAGKGYVILLPRYLINMNGYTTRWSDKPSLPAGPLEENQVFEKNLIDFIKDLVEDGGNFHPLFPIQRADRLRSWQDKADQVTIEEGSVSGSPAKEALDGLIYDPQKKRSLSIRHPLLKELAQAKIRSVFFHLEKEFGRVDSIERIADYLQDAGFNLIEGMLGVSPYEGLKTEESRKAYLENIRSILRVMESRGIKVFLGSYFPYGSYYRKKAYSKLVSSAGVEAGLPSPLDRTYWREAFLPLALEIAKLGREFPTTAVGMMWDLEFYYFDTVALSEAYSFDSIAFEVFQQRRKTLLESRKLASEARFVPQYLRFSWLKEKGLLKDYYQALEEEVAAIARWVDTEVKKTNPDLLWGFYAPGIIQSWFYTGLFRALGTPERPLLLITYEGRGNQQADYNAQKGIFFLHCPGLLLNTLKGQEWSESLPGLALREDGYWLYQGFQLFQDEDWQYGRNDFTFRESPADLRQSLKKANKKLDFLIHRGQWGGGTALPSSFQRWFCTLLPPLGRGVKPAPCDQRITSPSNLGGSAPRGKLPEICADRQE
ncbi:MAG: hypothetical protein ACUVV5_08260 [Candidatus Aminicenantales bacterium]